MKSLNTQQSGFTLIELVMVIVILGILSAFALPRFADLTGDARAASMNGLAGAIKSSAAIARSAQLAAGDTLGTSVTLDGTTVTMVNGYPTANAAGIVEAAGVSAGATGTAGIDYAISTGGTAGTSSLTFTIEGYSGTNCSVVYDAADGTGSDNTAPITNAASVTVTTSGC